MHDGEPVRWSDALTGIGTILAGIGTLGLAAAAGYAAFVSLRRYLEQRHRETDLDLAKLQGDLVALLRQEYERSRGSPDEGTRRDELEKAEDVYEEILRGIILGRPELMGAAREALSGYLEVTISGREVESPRRRGA